MSYNRWMPPLDELYHHGIRNMKWGERHGPPYPLSQKAHNAVVKESSQRSRPNKSVRKAEHVSKKGTASSYSKSLNRLSSISGESKARKAEYTDSYDKLTAKQRKYIETGKVKKAAKYEAKARKMLAKIEAENNNVQAAMAAWKRVGKAAAKHGYEVTLTKQYQMSSRATNDFVMSQGYMNAFDHANVVLNNERLDKEYREKHGTDYSPYAYDMQYAKVKKRHE